MSSDKKKKAQLNKGDFGYLDSKKKTQLRVSVFSMVMVAVICFTGIILYHSQKTIFAVMAALAALPAAKLLVGYIILAPYRSIGEELKNKLDSVRGNREYDSVLYDVALSSTEKAMYAGVIFIKNGKILGYTEHYKTTKPGAKGISLDTIEKHIKFIVDANCNYSVIKLYDNEESFLTAVEAEKSSEGKMSDIEKEKMARMNKRIAESLKVYMF